MPDTSRLIRIGHPITFILLAGIAFVQAVIASTLTDKYHSGHRGAGSHIVGTVHFWVFAGWWAFLFSGIYAGLFLTGKGGVVTSIAGHGLWIFLTWLFWLAGSASMTDALNGGVKCSSHPGLSFCNSLEALIAFGWIGTILLTVMLVVIGIIGGGAFRGGRSVKEGLSNA